MGVITNKIKKVTSFIQLLAIGSKERREMMTRMKAPDLAHWGLNDRWAVVRVRSEPRKPHGETV